MSFIEIKKQIEDKVHRWYVLSVVPGQESLTIKNLQERVKKYELDNEIVDYLNPTVLETKFKTNGEKVMKEVKLYPGYVFVKSTMNDRVRYVIRNTPGVRLIVGAETHPVPLTEAEFLQIQKNIEEKNARADLVVPFRAGDIVVINDGDFAGMKGPIKEIDQEKGFAIVSIEILGRMTSVMIGFDKINLI
ncbi:MAG: KOW motif-containing protein [Candidatus Absconditabacterales bacterium]|nr:KOW motif-containing protein [Candidatus Absconditabacterales bacterium]